MVGITNNEKDYLESFLILKVKKNILPLNLKIETNYLNEKSYVKEHQNDNVVDLFTGFIDNWSLFEAQETEKNTYVFNDKEEWTQFRNKYIPDISIPNVNFKEYCIVLYEDFNGAKPTLSSAFRIVDVVEEKDKLNVIYDDIPVYINFDSHLGLAISKVKKECITEYKRIDLRYKKEQ